MQHANHEKVLRALAAEYERHSPRSAALNREALRYLVDGGSHSLRLIRPFPPRIASASGAFVTDEDGHRILDFWQGHYANVLGHNPPELTGPLAEAFASGFGLQTGFTDRLQVEVAELVCRLTGSERTRFTSSGSLATMYAVLLARGFTGRDRVMKIGHVRIGRQVTLGPRSSVLYGAEVGDNVSLGPLTLVMKGECLPTNSRWHGCPAEPAT